MQNTPAINALIHDVIKIANQEGEFDTPPPPSEATAPTELAGFSGFIKASAKNIQKQIDKTHEYVTEHNKKQNEFEIQQKKDIFKTEVKAVLEKIDNGQEITNDDEEHSDIYRMILSSKMLIKLEKNDINKIINNIPSKHLPCFQALVENPALGKNLEYYPQIKCKILRSSLKQEDKVIVLNSFNNNPTRREAQSYQDPDILKMRTLEHAISLTEGTEENKYVPLFELWQQDRVENGGIKTAWSCAYDLDLKNTRSAIQNIIRTRLNVSDNNTIENITNQVQDEFAEDVKIFLEDLKGFSYALQVIDHKSNGTLDNKLADAIEYCSIYPEIVENKEKQLDRKYEIAYNKFKKEFPETIKKRDEAKAKHDAYKAEHDRKKELGQAVNDLLLGKYKSDLDTLEAQIEAHLPPKYHRSEFTKHSVKIASKFVAGVTVGAAGYVASPVVGSAATTAGAYVTGAAGATAGAATVAGVEMAGNTILQGTIRNLTASLSRNIEDWQRLKSLQNNVSQAMDNDDFSTASTTTASFNGIAQHPDPQRPNEVSEAERNSEIAKIETPFERISNVLDGINEENFHTVDNKVLSALFDITLSLAIDDKLSIEKRFAPFLKLMSTVPAEKFQFDSNQTIENTATLDTSVNQNTFMNQNRLFVVTDLIKDALKLNRGDYAVDLINSSVIKLKAHNAPLMNGEGELAGKFREELSEITEQSVALSNKPYDPNVKDKRAPLKALWQLTQTSHIVETEEDDPEELKDIPVTGFLPEIVDNALNDLKRFELDAPNRLINDALQENHDHVLKKNGVFNGRDKKFLSILISKAGRAINPNPLNDMVAKFLTLYEGGHFAEGGGFSDSVQDNHELNLNVLPRLVDLVGRERVHGGEPTILRRLDTLPRENQCAFKKVYDEANGNINQMRNIFNRCEPKPFKVVITPEMSKQRVINVSYASNASVPGSVGGNIG